MIGKITFAYEPEGWNQEQFLDLGGFTVVFLNYNKGAMIRESVTSALNQDYPCLEMFFMDDASTDGSGDIMEEIVRGYQGRHKVTIIRNTENQRICGQWNIVSKLATGNWLGMFCADDIAYPNRVSVVSKIVLSHPELRGICTNVRAINVLTNKVEQMFYHPVSKVWKIGKQRLSDAIGGTPIVGATAFWHKSLFLDPLPAAPLDDVLLRLILFAKCHRDDCARWLWCGDVETITYSLGAGTTSEGCNAGNEFNDDYVLKWVERREFVARMQRHWLNSIKAVETWLGCNLNEKNLLRQVHSHSVDLMYQADQVDRSFAWVPEVCSRFLSFHERMHLLYAVMVYHIRKLFGLKMAARIDHIIHSDKR